MTTPAPDALRLVPAEPTEAMLAAWQGWREYDVPDHWPESLRPIYGGYRAMLSAAPAVQPAARRVSADDIAAVREMIGIEYYAGKDAWAQALERILAAISTPAQASETGGEMIGHITQALVRADEEFGNSLSAYRYRKLAEAVAALSAPQAAPGEGEQS